MKIIRQDGNVNIIDDFFPKMHSHTNILWCHAHIYQSVVSQQQPFMSIVGLSSEANLRTPLKFQPKPRSLKFLDLIPVLHT